MSQIHAHIETDTADCDGRYTSGYTMQLTSEEVAEREIGRAHV